MNKFGEFMVRGKLTSNIGSDKDILFTANRFRLSKKHVLATDAIYQCSNLKGKLTL